MNQWSKNSKYAQIEWPIAFQFMLVETENEIMDRVIGLLYQ